MQGQGVAFLVQVQHQCHMTALHHHKLLLWRQLMRLEGRLKILNRNSFPDPRSYHKDALLMFFLIRSHCFVSGAEK